MELQSSRLAARVAKDGSPILLLDQDRSRWDLGDLPALHGYHLLARVRGDLLEKLGRLEEAKAEFAQAGNDDAK